MLLIVSHTKNGNAPVAKKNAGGRLYETPCSFRVFLYHCRFLVAWRVRRTFFPSGQCLFHLVTTGWILTSACYVRIQSIKSIQAIVIQRFTNPFSHGVMHPVIRDERFDSYITLCTRFLCVCVCVYFILLVIFCSCFFSFTFFCLLRWVESVLFLKKNLNASNRPSEHPSVRGENVKTFR